LTGQFYHLLSQKRREKFLEGIARQFVDKYKKYHNIHVIGDQVGLTIERRTQEKSHRDHRDQYQSTVELTEIIDKSLIGGFIVPMKEEGMMQVLPQRSKS